MQQLVMNKKIIRGVIDFKENFSAKDVLFNRNIAAGFFVNKFYYISPSTRYHAEMFLQLQFFTPPILAFFSKPSDYLIEANFARLDLSDEKKKQLQKLLEEEKLLELAEKTWEIAQGTSFEDNIDKIKLFCMLTAAYALARRSPTEEGFKITPEQAERAYLGELETDVNLTLKDIKFSATDTVISLPVRAEPYEIHLQRSEAVSRLENGSRITHKKLIAAPHLQGRNHLKLTLHIYNGSDYTAMELNIGEYIFLNAVDSCPVLVHPIPACGQTGDILCYAEQYEESYLTVRLTESGGKIYDNNYRNRRNDNISSKSAVEFIFNAKGHYIYLAPDGKIHERDKETDAQKRYAAIEDYLKEKENE